MRLSDLQSKNIITTEGKLIGNIIDVIIEDGFIKYLVTEKSKSLLNFLSSKNEYNIPWENIKTIGNDVIIVECKVNE